MTFADVCGTCTDMILCAAPYASRVALRCRYLGATGSNTSVSIAVLMGAGFIMALTNFAAFLVLRTLF